LPASGARRAINVHVSLPLPILAPDVLEVPVSLEGSISEWTMDAVYGRVHGY
jgi:hypothetical protein